MTTPGILRADLGTVARALEFAGVDRAALIARVQGLRDTTPTPTGLHLTWTQSRTDGDTPAFRGDAAPTSCRISSFSDARAYRFVSLA